MAKRSYFHQKGTEYVSPHSYISSAESDEIGPGATGKMRIAGASPRPWTDDEIRAYCAEQDRLAQEASDLGME